jgi:hypothetical protein
MNHDWEEEHACLDHSLKATGENDLSPLLICQELMETLKIMLPVLAMDVLGCVT